MKTFSYARARDAAEAVASFTPGTMYLGGGTNLVDLMRLGVAAPDRLVDSAGSPWMASASPGKPCTLARPSATATWPPTRWSVPATRCWPAPSWPGRRARSGTWPR